MLTHFTFSEGLTLASGSVQAFVAVVFLRFMGARPHWGLGWLGLSFGLAACLNLTAWYTIGLPPDDAAYMATQLVNFVIGVTCMAALTSGVRLYMGSQHPGPWATFAVVWVLYLMLVTLRKVHPEANLTTAGAVLAAAIYVYLAVLSLLAAGREPGVGHGVAGAMMAIYAPLVAAAHLVGLSATELRYWGSVPYALAGLGLMAATMGRLRQELKELNESLEHRVASRTQELQDIIEGLESFNRMVSHDLRGPLGGVHGISQLAVQALEQGDEARAKRLLQAIHSASGGLASLVTQLLSLAKSTQVKVNKQAVELQTVVDEALKWIDVSQGEGYTSMVQCKGLDRTVDVDAELMRQVMVNLISNAVKYSRLVSEPDVRVSAEAQDSGCAITVSDNGIGFDPSKQADLFKPFKRLHKDGEFEGFGIGLTIVQRIIQGHGGRVWAEGTPGKGATFHVWLPAR